MRSCVLVRFCKSYNLSKKRSRPINTRIMREYIARRLGFNCPPDSFICLSCKKVMYNSIRDLEIIRNHENEQHNEPLDPVHSPVRNNSPIPEENNEIEEGFGVGQFVLPIERPYQIFQLEPNGNEPEPLAVQIVDPLLVQHPNIRIEPENELMNIPEVAPMDPQIQIVNDFPHQNQVRPIIWRSLTTTQNRCCICPIQRLENPRVNQRCRIPSGALMVLWITDRIFVNLNNRCCIDHMDGGFFTEEALVEIRREARQRQLSQLETTDLVERLSNELELRSKTYLNFDSPLITNQDYLIFTSLTIAQFNVMFDSCRRFLPQGKKILSMRNCFAMFLTKLRTNFSFKILCILFGLRINQEPRVGEIIQEVLKALMTPGGFVSSNLGFDSLTRHEWFAEHGTTLTRTLYGLGEDQLCCILDETYLYCQKPSHHTTQSLLYSLPKHRHLFKMMSIVSPSGRFYDMLGPFPCDGKNNDAAHLIDQILTADDEDNIFNFFEEGDLFLVDRGYRDAIPTLENIDIRSLMPSTLVRGQRQHTDLEANRNRWITLIREIVERDHGRLKQKLKEFRDTVPNHSAATIAEEFKVAAAMSNAFYPRLKIDRQEIDIELGERINQRLDLRNLLLIRLEEEGLLRARVPWVNIDPFGRDLINFPILQIEDIKYLTLGIYQLKMSKGYIQAHMKRTGVFEIQLCRQILSPNEKLIRARMPSKFGGVAKINTAYVSFNPNAAANNHTAICAWYCDCKNGARVLGMCVHVTSIIFYLGFVRHNPELVNLPSSKFLESLINNRLPPNNYEHELFADDGDNEIPQDLEDQDH